MVLVDDNRPDIIARSGRNAIGGLKNHGIFPFVLYFSQWNHPATVDFVAERMFAVLPWRRILDTMGNRRPKSWATPEL